MLWQKSCGQWESHCFLKWQRNTLGLSRCPMATPKKNPQKWVFLNHTLLKSHDVSFEDFTILLKENSKFKLHLKESFLIKRDKPELNRNIYSSPLDVCNKSNKKKARFWATEKLILSFRITAHCHLETKRHLSLQTHVNYIDQVSTFLSFLIELVKTPQKV